ncbi:MAG: CBS domain-containing protein [Thaumarchaeota archaeon]|jgi:predicted transcriptional regulator|nr:CBS domain-containing protein [Nitrososphaerota archaeon]
MIKVSDAMVKKVLTIDSDESIEEAIKIMGKKHVGSLIVTKKGKPVALFTERDLLTRVLGKGVSTKKKVGKYSSSPLTVISPEMDLKDAARAMAQLKIRRLPVLKNGKLVGVITSADIVKAIAEAPLSI